MPRRYSAIVAALLISGATSAAAQERSAAERRPCGGEPGGGPAVIAFDQHLSLCLGSLAKIEFLGKFQLDWRDFRGDSSAEAFDLHRARVGTHGVILGRIEYELERELSDRDQRWRDAFVNVRVVRALELRAGRFKMPFGVEQLTSTMDLDLAYRSLASSYLTPGRDVGASVHGRLLGKIVRYESGVFRDSGDNLRASERDDPLNSVTVAARVTASPWKRPRTASMLKGLTFGFGTTNGVLAEGTNSLRAKTLSGDSILHKVFVNGRRQRFGADAEWRSGPVALRGEGIRVVDERRGQGTDDNDLPPAIARGGHLAASWLVTGEKNDGAITPRHAFLRGGVGAVEIAGRREWLSFGSQSSAPEAATARAEHIPRQSHSAWTFGINWYLNRFVRVQTNLTRSSRYDGGVPLIGANAWTRIVRVQLGL